MADFDAAGKGNLLIRDGFRFKDVDVDEKTNWLPVTPLQDRWGDRH